MGIEGESPLGGDYNGFSGGPARPEPPREPDQRMKRILLGGVAIALGLGLVGGLMARPNLGEGAPGKPAVQARADTDEQVRVLLNKDQPPAIPAPGASAPLEVITPAQAAAAPRATPVTVAAPPPAPQRVAAIDPPPMRPGVRRIETPPFPEEIDEADILDCRRPASRREARICRDLEDREWREPETGWRHAPPEEDTWDGPRERF